MDLRDLATDPDKEVHGARIEVDDETILIIARFNNKAFRQLQGKLMAPIARKAGKKGVTDKQADRVLNKVMAKTILVGWEGLKLNGELVEYSPEKAEKIFADERFADFKERVLFESQQLEHFRLQDVEADLGNSPASSST